MLQGHVGESPCGFDPTSASVRLKCMAGQSLRSPETPDEKGLGPASAPARLTDRHGRGRHAGKLPRHSRTTAREGVAPDESCVQDEHRRCSRATSTCSGCIWETERSQAPSGRLSASDLSGQEVPGHRRRVRAAMRSVMPATAWSVCYGQQLLPDSSTQDRGPACSRSTVTGPKHPTDLAGDWQQDLQSAGRGLIRGMISRMAPAS